MREHHGDVAIAEGALEADQATVSLPAGVASQGELGAAVLQSVADGLEQRPLLGPAGVLVEVVSVGQGPVLVELDGLAQLYDAEVVEQEG